MARGMSDSRPTRSGWLDPWTARLRGGTAVAVVLALLLAVAATLGGLIPTAAAAPTGHQVEKRYGPDFNSVQRAINASGWPQQDHIWCGLAAMDAVINWAKPLVSQRSLANWLNTKPAQSTWGTPRPNPAIAWGPAFKADISRDVGTDPRAIAIGQSLLTGGSYHVVVDRVGAEDATLHMIADLVRTQQPIHAIVFRGGHSVIVSGVRATGDPVKDPGSITALEVWDPGFGIYDGNIQPYQMTLVTLNEWYNNHYYWSSPYDEDLHGAIAQDPDPAIGPYTYDPNAGLTNHLWVGNYVYLRPDLPGDPAASLSPDWELNQDGALIAGARGEYPQSWPGKVVALESDRVIRDASPTFTQTEPSVPTQTTPSSQPFWSCNAAWCRWLDPRNWWILGGPLLALAGLALLAAMRAEVRTARAGTKAQKRARAVQPWRQKGPRISHLWDDVPDNDIWRGDFARRGPSGGEGAPTRPDLRETRDMPSRKPSSPQEPGHTGYTTGRMRAYDDEWE